MKIFLLLWLVTFTVHAATLESFFTSLEGGWEMESAQSVTFRADGGVNTSVASQFSASVTRKYSLWNFAEYMCWSTDGAEEVCSEASVTWEVQGNSLFMISDGVRTQVEVVAIDEHELGICLKTKDYVFNAIIGLKEGILLQDSVTELSDGTSEYQSLRLLKQ